jgi:hypothetical protein
MGKEITEVSHQVTITVDEATRTEHESSLLVDIVANILVLLTLSLVSTNTL